MTQAQTIEQSILESFRGQPLGEGTLADLQLPDEFLTLAGDRLFRAKYRERYRVASPDSAQTAEHVEQHSLDPTVLADTPPWVFGVGYALIAVLVAIWISRRGAA